MARHCWIALSGGLDSQVLLHFFATRFPHLALQAIHINHQLMPQAQAWEVFCQKSCDQLDVPLKIIRVEVPKKSGLGLEAAARHARYTAFRECLQKEDVLLTAHHLDDQAETVLLRLFRGSGLRGAAAISDISSLGEGYLVRPFLTYTRQALVDYAVKHQLRWVEDPSNQDTALRRNFLRHQVLPLLKQYWPELSRGLSRFAEHCAEQNSIIQEIAGEDTKACQSDQPNALSLSRLNLLSRAKQMNVLRYWLDQAQLPMPPVKVLQEILFRMHHAKEDANPYVVWQNMVFRRYHDQLRVLPYDPQTDVSSPDTVWFEKLTPSQIAWCQKHLPYALTDKALRMTTRQGGERFRPVGSKQTRTLKNLFQEWGVPPWERNQIPLLYYQDTLIAVVGFSAHL